MTERKEIIQYTEGSPWFWKIFGGAILGLISILLLGHITNINSTIDRTFLELRGDLKEVRVQQDAYKDRLTAIEQGGCKDKVAAMEKVIDDQRQRLAAYEASAVALKEEVKTLREWNKETSRKLQEVSEKVAAEIKKKPE
jgi:uncharacterized coiled-coil DUF342 family protein